MITGRIHSDLGFVFGTKEGAYLTADHIRTVVYTERKEIWFWEGGSVAIYPGLPGLWVAPIIVGEKMEWGKTK